VVELRNINISQEVHKVDVEHSLQELSHGVQTEVLSSKYLNDINTNSHLIMV